MVNGALSHIKVLDFTTHVAGPYCTKLLADYGADVIKVERPGIGDSARSKGPFPGDVPHPEKSGLFLHLNTNKRSITLDLKSNAGKRIAMALAADADLIVENFRPGVIARLGLGLEALQAANPKLVMTSIS
nr:CoA transferase [Dehalococcoidia bacterium]